MLPASQKSRTINLKVATPLRRFNITIAMKAGNARQQAAPLCFHLELIVCRSRSAESRRS